MQKTAILFVRLKFLERSEEKFVGRTIPLKAEGITRLLRLRLAAMAEQGRLAGTPLLCGGIRVQGLP